MMLHIFSYNTRNSCTSDKPEITGGAYHWAVSRSSNSLRREKASEPIASRSPSLRRFTASGRVWSVCASVARSTTFTEALKAHGLDSCDLQRKRACSGPETMRPHMETSAATKARSRVRDLKSFRRTMGGSTGCAGSSLGTPPLNLSAPTNLTLSSAATPPSAYVEPSAMVKGSTPAVSFNSLYSISTSCPVLLRTKHISSWKSLPFFLKKFHMPAPIAA
mmetsp:Transcript_22890/g.74088  ORF Transcript_22890/g.74088 Transcript_22890/m.74088 type:complete len:220 (-) Transcript_22890:188-847(-)